jgi:hypothetical protein
MIERNEVGAALARNPKVFYTDRKAIISFYVDLPNCC